MRLITSLALTSALLGGCVVTTDNGDSDLTVTNSSDYTIDELYVTSVGNSTWGANLLGGDSLFSGESITIGVQCGTYDALLVDETNVECELHSVDLCFDSADWVIRNNTCTVFGARTTDAAKPADAAAAKSTTTTDAI